MAAKIVIRHVANSSLNGRTQTFDSDLVRLGRREGNDVIFDARQDTLVSGAHAEIRAAGGQLSVNDCGSTNGTYVNGQRIGGPTRIGAHDRVTLGSGGPEMRLELAGIAAQVGAPVASMGEAGGAGFGPPAGMHPVAQPYAPAPFAPPAFTPPPAFAPPPMFASPALASPVVASPASPAFAPAYADARPAAGPVMPGFDFAPSQRPAGGMDRPMSRMAQGLPNRPIGMHTLIGVLQKSKNDERRRILLIAMPFLLLLLGGGVYFYIRAQNVPAPAVVNTTSTIVTPPETRPAEPTWPEVYRKVEPSVYMIQAYKVVGGQNIFFNSGTGWSVKPGLLATNSHVSELFDMVQPNGFVIARRGKAENDLRIIKVRQHPGYAQAGKMGLDYRPFSPEAVDFTRATSLNACDVAILEVHPDDIKKQGLPLPLADTGAVESGTKVAYVGFPVEGSVAVNYQEPSPYATDAAVNRLLGFLAEDTQPGKETFVGHSLNTLGGSSGSPIVNLKGEVVAVNFAGDNVGKTKAGRMILAGFNYGVPVDMVKELLDTTTLEAKQEVRRKQWETVLTKAFEAGVAKPRLIFIKMLNDSLKSIAENRNVDPAKLTLKEVVSDKLKVEGDTVAKLTCAEPGEYIIVAVGDQPGDGLNVDLVLGASVAKVNAVSTDGKTRRVYWGSATANIVTAGAGLQLKMSAAKPTNVVYAMYVVKDR